MRLAVFKSYLEACGVVWMAATLAFYAVYLGAQVFTNIWLSNWASDPPSASGTQDQGRRDLRLGVYGAMGGVQGRVFVCVCVYLLGYGCFDTLVLILKACLQF